MVDADEIITSVAGRWARAAHSAPPDKPASRGVAPPSDLFMFSHRAADAGELECVRSLFSLSQSIPQEILEQPSHLRG
jgi:hypothetical protein